MIKHIQDFFARTEFKQWVINHLPHVSANTLQITAVVLFHAATLPSLISIMLAWTDHTPMLDMVILVWAGLIAMFAQAMVQKNQTLAILISAGFMFQSMLMALIFFQ
jgi:hypothetical protein